MRYRNRQSESLVRRGLAATELAMWLPFLSLMFVIALDYCRVFYASQTVQNCACAGAMYAGNVSWADSSGSQNPAIAAALAEGVSLNPPLQANNVAISITGTQVQVTVTYEFPFIVRWPGRDSLIITRSVTMAIVPQPSL